jgi:hypothetical protein
VPTFTFVALAGFLVLTLPSLGRGRRIIGALTVLFPVRALTTIAVPLCLSIGAVLASTANCALRQATISGCSQVDANFNSIPLTVDLGSASSFETSGWRDFKYRDIHRRGERRRHEHSYRFPSRNRNRFRLYADERRPLYVCQ